ncbi:MAG: hypothetical protein L0Z55_07145 [Planctomycetes bacterium]|nr:hypothetical protein [Planctomycetota bacterium]
MAKEEFLRGLNELFAEELEAGIRYLHLAVTVTGLDRLLVRKVLLENMNETLEHAQVVADKILQLGGVPKLELKLHLAPEKTNAKEAIRTALAFETAALDAYRDLLEKVGNKDVALEEFLRAQVALESQHVAELELLLEG